jgi:transcription elongation factor Elf1
MKQKKIKKLNLDYIQYNCTLCGKVNEKLVSINSINIHSKHIKSGCEVCGNVDVIKE